MGKEHGAHAVEERGCVMLQPRAWAQPVAPMQGMPGIPFATAQRHTARQLGDQSLAPPLLLIQQLFAT